VLAHLYTIQSQLAANFLLEITPAEDVLEVALAPGPVESLVAINRLGEIFFARRKKARANDKRWGRGSKGKESFSFSFVCFRNMINGFNDCEKCFGEKGNFRAD
jgi:hypothetical protein